VRARLFLTYYSSYDLSRIFVVAKKRTCYSVFWKPTAYCLNFVKSFFNQLYNNKPKGDYYHPKDVIPILPLVLMEEKQRVWNRITVEKFYFSRSHMSRTGSSCEDLLKTCLDPAKFKSKYGQKTVTVICSKLNVLSIWREANTVN
jgi:hypothetical protein